LKNGIRVHVSNTIMGLDVMFTLFGVNRFGIFFTVSITFECVSGGGGGAIIKQATLLLFLAHTKPLQASIWIGDTVSVKSREMTVGAKHCRGGWG
jgi:hypothetical protein